MNTALNFVSLPKDTGSMVAPGEPAVDNRSATMVEPGGKRQDIADGAEKNASFAKVLKEESRQDTSKTEATSTNKTTEHQQVSTEKKDARTAKAATDEDSEAANAVEADATGETPETEKSQADSRIQMAALSLPMAVQADNSDDQQNMTIVAVTKPDTEDSTTISDSEPAGDDAEAEINVDQITAVKSTTQMASQQGPVSVDEPRSATDAKKQDQANSTAAELTLAANSDSDSKSITETAPLMQSAAKHNADQKTELTQSSTASANHFTEASQKPTGTNIDAEVAIATESEAKLKATTGSLSASLESFPAAGRPLPSTGKSLPAGLFFQADGEAAVISRGEQSDKVAQQIDLNNALANKQVLGEKLNPATEFELADGKSMRALANTQEVANKADLAADVRNTNGVADKLIRTILGAQSLTVNADISAPATSTAPVADNLGVNPPLPNALLQVSNDRSLATPRSVLPTGSESTFSLNITSQAGSAEWHNQLSSSIRWMGNTNMSSAELKLHPAELGAVEIKITTEDDQTRVSFITSNAAAKDLIESSLPRLREMLGAGGLQLEQGDVAHRDRPEDSQGREFGSGPRAEHEESESNELQQATVQFTRNSTSQIDHYV